MSTGGSQAPAADRSTFTASSRVHPDKQQLLADSWNEVAALYVQVRWVTGWWLHKQVELHALTVPMCSTWSLAFSRGRLTPWKL